MKYSYIVMILIAAVVGCGKSDNKKSNIVRRTGTAINEKNTTLSYQFEHNDCDTEKKTFTGPDAKVQMCQALQDDEFNNNCAEELRKLDFACSKCRGQKWKGEDIDLKEMDCQTANLELKNSSKDKLSYEFKEEAAADTDKKACTTGKHKYNNKEADKNLEKFCVDIQDDELNKNCASEERAKKFSELCG